MLGNLNGWHLLILLAVILLLFGAAKLPALAKSVGQSARVFKGEMKAMKDEDATVDRTVRTHNRDRLPSLRPPPHRRRRLTPPNPSRRRHGHGRTAAHRRTGRTAARQADVARSSSDRAAPASRDRRDSRSSWEW